MESDVPSWIAIEGDPIKGFIFYGPFEDETQAEQWAADNLWKADWWVSEVEPVDYYNDIEIVGDDDEDDDDEEIPLHEEEKRQRRAAIIAAEASGVGR